MSKEEAIEWLKGNRSMIDSIPSDEQNLTWILRTAQTDAAMTEQAYWIVKAHAERLLP